MIRVFLLFLSTIFLLACQKDILVTPENNVEQKDNKKSSQLRATTFNLKWYGMKRKGGYEFRNPYLKRFIEQELSDSDIILFTEVVSPELLPEIVGSKMDCQDDEFPDGFRNQQRNALCYDRSKFRIEAYDDDYMIPEVAIKRPGKTRTGLRPALHLKLCHLKGDCFLQVIGLHLKAGKSWHKRAAQMRFVRDELSKQANPLPTMIIGDMNSYLKARKTCGNICINQEDDPQTCEVDEVKKFECTEDDLTVFNSILKEAHNRTYRAVTRGQKTYSVKWGLDYDHIILTSDIQAKDIETYPSCDKDTSPETTFIPYFPTFRKYISDHCPVSATLTFSDEGQ